MKESPILFNTRMVEAILDGRKTQTRRLIKPTPLGLLYEDGSPAMNPPVEPGDILWVRETWCSWWLPHGAWQYRYKATQPYGNIGAVMPDSDDEPDIAPWRPSIHMPRAAARIFLRVESVEAERLQSISHEDVLQEGIEECEGREHGEDCACAEIRFSELWNSTIKPADLPRYGWGANPWVWVIRFERLEGYK